MGKRKISNSERFAVWKAHDGRCFWCEAQLFFRDATVDHVLPESLNVDRIESIKEDYALPGDFEINDFQNWVPAHNKCNQRKGARIYPASTALIYALERVGRLADTARKIEQRLRTETTVAESLTKVVDTIKNDDEELDKQIILDFAEQIRDLIEDDGSLPISERWEVVESNGELEVVSDGRMTGVRPTAAEPHPSWRCPNCGSHGPWNGVICLNCGSRSNPSR